MQIKGWPLKFFQSGEWQVVNERLKDLEKVNRPVSDGYNPPRSLLFDALRRTPLEEVKVAIIGQDPYPTRAHATGIAFSIPQNIQQADWPITLRTFLDEYRTDLGYPLPSNGDLSSWCAKGVLLWNAIPSCRSGASLSHDWRGGEWGFLTKEIIELLSERGTTFALLGQIARRYLNDIKLTNNNVVVTSHPSPRGNVNSRSPFTGSRLFSTINDKLCNNGQEIIDWKLP
jgi:uracil-DNA glycosylase